MDNSMPKYHFVFSDLKSKIQNGEYKINEILPSEPQLQEMYGVSRITIRRAMDELQNIHFVRKYSGIGTIVINNKNLIPLKRVSSFSDENKERSSKLIKFEEIVAPLEVRIQLKLNSDERVYLIERLRSVEDKKIGIHIAYVPIKYIELSSNDFKGEGNSLYRLFHESNIKLDKGIETIEAVVAEENIVNLLGIKDNTPILYKERTSYFHDKPIEFVKMYYRGDMYKYQIELKN